MTEPFAGWPPPFVRTMPATFQTRLGIVSLTQSISRLSQGRLDAGSGWRDYRGVEGAVQMLARVERGHGRGVMRIVWPTLAALVVSACISPALPIRVGDDSVDLSPRVSPDGLHVVFSSDRAGPASLFLVDLPRGEVTQLTDTAGLDIDPTWLSDGSGIVYSHRASAAETSVSSLRAVTLKGEQISVETTGAYEAFPDVGPEGLIAVACIIEVSYDICVRSLDPADGAIVITDPDARDWQPAWSPDGRTLLFTSDVTGNDDIWAVDMGTGVRLQITDSTSKESDPTWSPDGTQIAFSSDRGGESEIWIMNADGSSGIALTSGTKPHWSPTGEFIAFHGQARLPDTGVSIKTIDLASGSVTVVSR